MSRICQAGLPARRRWLSSSSRGNQAISFLDAHKIRDVRIKLGCIVKNPRKFTVLIERDEDGYYVATVPSLRGCHTQAKTLDALMKRTREAIAVCLASEGMVPSLELIGIQQISV